jgi:hypothetical protein
LDALAGGDSPHNPSIRRSDETVEPAWSASIAKSARGLPPPIATGCPSTLASTGPRSRISNALYGRPYSRSNGPTNRHKLGPGALELSAEPPIPPRANADR